ncbi:LysM peptidoglycan-binding domain-containing protein [Streptomyces sp. NBC_01456]|uniref:CIS tube protein n=1 Tax=unclassified Streptomyces TaxID=2593676 RepID=UPI002E363C8F|nr:MULTISPECIES: LysM peptidoglycan-binding domain-containing protein [unclassified Streptomyces]
MLPELLGGAPVRAALVIYDPPTGTGNAPGPERGRVRFHFNPDRVQVGKQARWDRSPAPSSEEAARAQFVGAQPRTMTLEVFLDAGDFRSGVQDQVEKLLDCCAPTARSATAKPASAPWVRLEWGRSRTTAFLALVTQVDAAYTRFGHDGTPLRATCTVSLEEVGGSTPRQNPTSGGDGAVDTHLVVAGDTLAGLAWQAYGDPTRWRAIAAANGVDDPAQVPVGTVLVLPVLEERPSGGTW